MLFIKDGKTACASCNYKTDKKPKIESSEKIAQKEIIAIINEKENTTDPTVQIECKKCKNKLAYFWTTQTRASDESETKFYKCTKCEHTWREYR